MIEDVLGHLHIWSDGRMEPILHLDVKVVGAGFYTHALLAFLTTYDGDTHKIWMDESIAAPISFLSSLASCNQAKELSVGAFLQAFFLAFMLGLVTSTFLMGLPACLLRTTRNPLFPLLRMVVSLPPYTLCFGTGAMMVSKVEDLAYQFMVAEGSVRQDDGADRVAHLGRLR